MHATQSLSPSSPLFLHLLSTYAFTYIYIYSSTLSTLKSLVADQPSTSKKKKPSPHPRHLSPSRHHFITTLTIQNCSCCKSPRRTVYYVQSPSRDSHDGEKTATSFHSTPIISPMASPGRHSRQSSSTRYSGSGKAIGAESDRQHHSKGDKQWKNFDSIKEEGLLDDEDGYKGIPRRCYVLAFVGSFLLLFSLVLWGASRNQKPIVTLQTISFDNFVIQAGNDFSGVTTELATVNSTVKFTFRNTGAFFGVHVQSSPVVLNYSQLPLAAGNIKQFYQSRKSQRTVSVLVQGTNLLPYGGGADLGSKDGSPSTPVPLALNFVVRSRAYVLGKLVKPKFYNTVQCVLVLDPKKMNSVISLKNSCTYQ